MRKVTERVVMSFTCFAMFFGAGNLTFPAFLSYKAGGNTVFAFLGFILSAITLPVLSLIAVGISGSLDHLSARVNPLFSKVFTIVIYLAIGPMLAIPRTASTSFEMVRMAFNLEEKFSQEGIEPRRSEGVREGRWGVIDYGDVVVHVFNEESRLYYYLERLWDSGRNVERYED